MPRPKSNAWVKKAKKAVKKPKVEIQEPEEDVELQEEASRALSRRVAEERARAKLAARAAEAKEAETDEERFSFAPHPVTWAEAAALDGGDGWCGGADDDDAALALGAEAGGGEADPLGLNAEPASPRRGAGHAALAHAKDFDAVAYLNGAHGAASFAQLEAGWATLKARLGTQERKVRGVVRENLATFLRSAARLERFARALERLARGPGSSTAADDRPAAALAVEAQGQVATHFGSLLGEVDAARDAEDALAAFRCAAPLLDFRAKRDAALAAGDRGEADRLRARAAALRAATDRLARGEDASPVAALLHGAARAVAADDPAR